MLSDKSLLLQLEEYCGSDYYPFHMPGHKRCGKAGMGMVFPDPFTIDITEIDGFDNLHHPEGMIKESMDWAASVYGADQTYYLVNGSSCGLLSAICACTKRGGTILISRNCHKSVYHGVILNQLNVEYVYPQIIPETGLQGGLLVQDIEKVLINNATIQAVLLVSPTYDGIVSDIRAAAEVVHRYGIPLIVDEAHGAHFHYGDSFPVSALSCGADVVVQSLHKTLPSLTQTAVLHLKKGYVEVDLVERYLRMYQSTSPSYVLMASIDSCIRRMVLDGRSRMNIWGEEIGGMRRRLGLMRHLKLLDMGLVGLAGIFDMDQSKLVVMTRGTKISGNDLLKILNRRYHLELEMCGPDYVMAITTVMDQMEGLMRLERALLEIDEGLADDVVIQDLSDIGRDLWCRNQQVKLPIWKALESECEVIEIQNCEGRISSEFIYVYPPGIPLVTPGEVLSKEILSLVHEYQKIGLPVQGPVDVKVKRLRVIR